MNPALSVVVFTTAAGAGQGLVVALALAALAGIPLAPASLRGGLAIAIVLLVVGLAASFLHLGRPTRAWRAWLMWRTSWLSREVVVLPAFIALVAAWWLVARDPAGAPASLLMPLAAIAVSALLWLCTAMIYACLRFIEEWAQPLTVVNFVLLGLSSGLVLACALAAIAGEGSALAAALPGCARRDRRRRRCARRRHAPQRRASPPLDAAVGDRHRRRAAGADVDGDVGRLVQHARVLPSRLGGGVANDQAHRRRARVRRSRARRRARLGRRVAGVGVRVCRARARRPACSPTAGSFSRRRSIRKTCTTRSCRDARFVHQRRRGFGQTLSSRVATVARAMGYSRHFFSSASKRSPATGRFDR
jgi:hypothetical protein